jgi:hypothetical protein
MARGEVIGGVSGHPCSVSERFVVGRDWILRFVVGRDWIFAKSGMAASFSDHHTPVTTRLYFGKVPVPSGRQI